MKQFTVLINLLFITFFVNGQEKVFEISGGFSKNHNNKESFSISDQIQGDLMILLSEKKYSKAILVNTEYTSKSEINTISISSKYKHLLGYNIDKNIYSLFFTNNRNTRFGVQTFDFENLVSSVKLLDFRLKKETFIETINYNNTLYLLSISKNSPNLNIYTFDKDFTPHKKVVSLKHLEYRHQFDGSLFSPHDIFIYNDIAKIESNNPNVIETTSKKIKIYLQDHQVIFCLDHRNKITQLEYLDLNTFELIHKNIKKDAHIETGYRKSNSYIFDNKIFQIASSNQKMKFTITDLATEKMIKEYKIAKKDTIQFKNSPIIQEGGGMFPAFSENRIREMEKTSKYLRKISSGDIGISVYKVDSQYNIILGGTQKITSGGGYYGPTNFGVGFSTGGTFSVANTFSVGFNPTFYGYNNYNATKSTYINCLFDENFNHVKGDIPLNSFDIINNFEDTLKEPMAVTIFRHNQQLHYGYIDSKDTTYKIYKFTE